MNNNQASKKRHKINVIQAEANEPKMHLIGIRNKLEDIGAMRQAKSLNTIIARLEAWQKTK